MGKIDTKTDYDSSATDFDKFRMPSPRILDKLRQTFAPVDGLILSIGCGTGQYEYNLSKNKIIVGLDKSKGMIKIAQKRIDNCVLGNMLELPFADNSFKGVYFMQSFHHMGANFSISQNERIAARKKVLSEAFRILKGGHLLIIQRDPSQNQAIWFWKYFPKALEKKLIIQPKISTLVEWLSDIGLQNIEAIPVYDPMIEGFYDPQGPLQKGFRRSFSEFSYLSESEMRKGVQDLKDAVEKGIVEKEILACREKFKEIGGTVFIVSAYKV